MKKQLDLSQSVCDLVSAYPELKDILVQVGLNKITNDSLLHTAGKLMTIPKGAAMHGISMDTIQSALQHAGFTLTGLPDNQLESSPLSRSDCVDSSSTDRKQLLKSYLQRLGNQEDLEEIRAEFVAHFKDVDASEIMEAEQEMMEEGVPVAQVQKLCDLHSALFHGHTTREKQVKATPLILQNAMSSDQEEVSAETLQNMEGHPLQTLMEENRQLNSLIQEYQLQNDPALLPEISQVAIHYAKKGDLLYPLLHARYQISGPSQVMWSVDDEIRNQFGRLCKTKECNASWQKEVDGVLQRMLEMIYKEENILFPLCAKTLSEKDWMVVYADAKDYAPCLGVPFRPWKEAEIVLQDQQDSSMATLEQEGLIRLPEGTMKVQELQALLNVIPMEITFVDANNINRYFNAGHKVFKRPSMALNREVFYCHPPKAAAMARQILQDFKTGAKDEVSIWMEKGGEPFLVRYLAIRNEKGDYLGAAELVQNMTFAKEHFCPSQH